MIDSDKKSNHVGILAALTTSLFFVLLNSGSPTPLYPLYKELLDFNNIDLTFIFSSYGFGVLVTLFITRNFKITVKNSKFFLLISFTIIVLSNLGFAFSRSLFLLCAFRFVSGLGSGIATTFINTLLIRFSHGDSAKRAALMGSLALVAGLALGPVISSIYFQVSFFPLSSPAITVAAFVLLSAIAIAVLWPHDSQHRADAKVETAMKDTGHFSKLSFLLAALCVFVSWSYAALILSMGPTTAISVFAVRSPAYFGYCATCYLIVASIFQFILPRFLKPEYSLISGLITQIFSMVIMAVSLEYASILGALISLVLSGISYGAVFIGGAILVNRISVTAPGWNAVPKFYFIIYLFNIVPPIAGWLADKIGLLSALSISIYFFISVYAVFGILTFWHYLLKQPELNHHE
ncbi:MFS transporter [Bartonella sp. LJL80]